ncbi:hypothetical protein B0H19DRAFT_1376611 [Mycena capillaripes]|nr:hypothetical protein B0H19DRAFT_1376611 [Mycena capillaripes]
MFPTRARAMFSSQLRRQTAAPGGAGGRVNPNTSAGKNNNNMLMAVGAAVTLSAAYLIGFSAANKDKGNAKGAATTIKNERSASSI